MKSSKVYEPRNKHIAGGKHRQIYSHRRCWFGYIKRMEQHMEVKLITEWRPSGSGLKRRPKSRCEGQVRGNLGAMGEMQQRRQKHGISHHN